MKVYNTLTRKKEEFIPQDNVVKMYVCGSTVYAESHIGHAMSYIVFDMIRRYLEFRGYEVKHVTNFTDVDDKIIARANQLGIAPQELAQTYIDQYFADMAALNVQPAHIYPRASEEIPKILEVISGLIDKGHAYQANGDIYFRVESDTDYGKLSHRRLDSMMAGARIEVGESKQHPLDFALWKAAKPGEPQWDSPWGKGRPGWHIECSAMSLKYLGDSLDIHGGGQDLIFPHHENEIAQSERYTTVTPFARYWLHNGLMQLGEEKMSKSLGNLITIGDALEKYGGDALRLFILSSHYRSPITYTEEGLMAALKGTERIREAATIKTQGSSPAGIDLDQYHKRFIEAMDDDFNTAQSVAVLFDLVREINREKQVGCFVSEAQAELQKLAGILGLRLDEPKMTIDVSSLAQLNEEVSRDILNMYPDSPIVPTLTINVSDSISVSDRVEVFTENLTRIREWLRGEKQWQLADKIRSRLSDLGIALEDTPEGTIWKRKL